jgi:hypothetical protein
VRLDIQRLDDDQLQTLVVNWRRQFYPGEAAQRTTELVRAIQEINALRTDRDLPPFVSTPLLTTMVVSVKWGETELPRERARLYEACVKVILQAQYLQVVRDREGLLEGRFDPLMFLRWHTQLHCPTVIGQQDPAPRLCPPAE